VAIDSAGHGGVSDGGHADYTSRAAHCDGVCSLLGADGDWGTKIDIWKELY
jgi:hypothetical protein